MSCGARQYEYPGCPRCGHLTAPRGGLTPRYCAVCGQRLVPLHAEVQSALSSKRPSSLPLRVVALIGICSLLWLFFGHGC